jgi:hypothetical protein
MKTEGAGLRKKASWKGWIRTPTPRGSDRPDVQLSRVSKITRSLMR